MSSVFALSTETAGTCVSRENSEANATYLERTQVWFHGEGRLLKRTRFILQLNAPLYRPSRPVHILTSVGEENLDRVLPHGADAHAAKFDSAENS